MVVPVQSPEKELRFTRSGQAIHVWLAAAILAATGLTLLSTSIYRDINPLLPHPAWAALPLAAAAAMVKLGMKMTRHAYLILTPLGIEIFPFFRPAERMQLLLWQEVNHAEVDEKKLRLTLHRDSAKTSGIHLSLRPIRADRRTLLSKAVLGRLSPIDHTD